MTRAWRPAAALVALSVAACAAARNEVAPPADTPAAASASGASGAGVAQDSATVRDVLERPALVGQVVRVRGRCLGYAVARAAGPPPRTRSDWQLEAAGAAVWVTGTRPPGCSTADGSTADDTVVARVAQDTIPALGGGAGRARRYLIRVE